MPIKKDDQNIIKKLTGFKLEQWDAWQVPKKILTGLAFLIIILIVISLGLYWGNWQGRLWASLGQIMPFPATIVNGQMIKLNEVFAQQKMLEKIATLSPQVKLKNSITALALQRAVENKILEQIAKKFQLQVSDDEVAKYMGSLVANFGSPLAIEDLVKKEYDWDLKTYVDNFVRPTILNEKLSTYWENISPNKEAYQKIQELATKLKAKPEQFQILANQYNQDETASVKGEIGWLSYGDLLPELQKIVITLEPGQISPIITSNQGYHLLKIGQKTTDDQGREVWQAYQIFFKRYPFSQYLSEEIKKAKVITLLKL
ncbi:MAG: peptidylprolyl isomerase [Candidatus Komeilibacteria bacterium]|nr:peptidylprolyl isomerase [Candidatus Komeilibacteria bacterium]